MLQFDFEVDGKRHLAVSEEDLKLLYPKKAKVLWAAKIAEHQSSEGRKAIRRAITKEVAGTDSLLGTTADGAQFAVAALLVDVIALDQARTFAEYKAARLSLMGELTGKDRETGKAVNVPALAQSVFDKIKSGEVMLTAGLKGVPGVLAEVMERSTKVAAIIAGGAR